jgi:hypothetical protein
MIYSSLIAPEMIDFLEDHDSSRIAPSLPVPTLWLEHNHRRAPKLTPPPPSCILKPVEVYRRYAGAIFQGGEGTAEDVSVQSPGKEGSHHAAVSLKNLRKQVGFIDCELSINSIS